MTSQQRWFSALWPKVQRHLPPPPAVVVEVGCGPLGGFVPALNDHGYRAVGVDPVAPEGSDYRRIEFERSDLDAQADAIVACTSLHHVADVALMSQTIANNLAAGGLVVVVEWDWESFDAPTAEWCFERLGAEEPETWLHRQRRDWKASAEPWEQYVRRWAEQEGLHSWLTILHELDRRFQRLVCGRGAYFFPDLAHISEADELRAVDTGQIQANRIDYVGRFAEPMRDDPAESKADFLH